MNKVLSFTVKVSHNNVVAVVSVLVHHFTLHDQRHG